MALLNPPLTNADCTMTKAAEHQSEEQEEQVPVTFKAIHRGTKCVCTEDSRHHLADVFIRESKNEQALNKTDFLSHWNNPAEKRKRRGSEGTLGCTVICSLKGLSVQRHCRENPNIRKLKSRHDLRPHRRPYLHLVKFGDRIGCVKDGVDDLYHCNLYLSDEFDPDQPYAMGHITALRVERLDDLNIDQFYANV